jgi:hypothetical protein
MFEIANICYELCEILRIVEFTFTAATYSGNIFCTSTTLAEPLPTVIHSTADIRHVV